MKSPFTFLSKAIRVFCLFIMAGFAPSLYSQHTPSWVKGINGPGNFYVDDLTNDGNGNVYMIGRLTSGTMDFDPGAGITNITALSNLDIVFGCYSSTGTLIWVNRLVDNPSGWGTAPYSIGVFNEALYIAGTFLGTVDFDPGAGITNVTGVGNMAPFLARYTLSGGLVWAETFGTDNNDHIYGMDIDNAGNIYLSMVLGGVGVDMDPGAGVTAIPVAGNTGAMAKFNGITGALMYSFSVNATLAGWKPMMDIAVDQSGNFFVCGIFDGGQIDLDPGAGSALYNNAGGFDMYISSYNATSGTLNWSGGMCVAGDQLALSIDASTTAGMVSFVGYYNGTVDMNIGAGVNNITAPGGTGTSAFCAGYNNGSGNYVFASSFDGTGSFDDVMQAITFDNCPQINVAGTFNSPTVDLDPGVAFCPANNTNAGGGSSDIMMVKLSLTGTVVSGGGMGSSSGNDWPECLNLNTADGSVLLGGDFHGTVDFDYTTGVSNLAGGVTSDQGYFNKYISPCNVVICSPLPVEIIDLEAIQEEKDVLIRWRTMSETNNDYFYIERSPDAVNWEQVMGRIPGGGNSNIERDYAVTDTDPMNGMNYYRLVQVDFDGTVHSEGIVVANFNSVTLAIYAYPNPVEQGLRLSSCDWDTYKILTLRGEIEREGPVGNCSISLEELAAGTYILLVENQNGTHSYLKLIKK